jgi:hypothetical protein
MIDTALRVEKALQMRRQKASWDKIAKECDYHDRSNARRAVMTYLSKIGQSDDAKGMRQEEAMHLDDLQMRHMQRALSGSDLKAAEFVLKVIDRRIRLFGLDVNEGRLASAAEVQAMAEMASTIGLHAHLISAMTDAGLRPDQMDAVIAGLNARIMPRDDDIPGEVEDDRQQVAV